MGRRRGYRSRRRERSEGEDAYDDCLTEEEWQNVFGMSGDGF